MPKEPATNEEVKAALALSRDIEQFFAERGYAAPTRVMSGNGIHLYYPLELPNDESARDECQLLLKGLGLMFDTDLIQVDTGVFNASRITKLPGTIARKGAESEERPYRKAVIL